MQFAIDAYPDGIIDCYVNEKTGKFEENKHGGDGLARFIACELTETFEPKETREAQLHEAIRCLRRASDELEEVIQAFEAQL